MGTQVPGPFNRSSLQNKLKLAQRITKPQRMFVLPWFDFPDKWNAGKEGNAGVEE
jgi:hypothetical protein